MSHLDTAAGAVVAGPSEGVDGHDSEAPGLLGEECPRCAGWTVSDMDGGLCTDCRGAGRLPATRIGMRPTPVGFAARDDRASVDDWTSTTRGDTTVYRYSVPGLVMSFDVRDGECSPVFVSNPERYGIAPGVMRRGAEAFLALCLRLEAGR